MVDDRFKTPAYRRAVQESRAYEFQTRWTFPSLRISPRPDDSTSDLDRDLSFRDLWTKNKSRKLADLEVDDCRLFCWKDCAVYSTSREAADGVLDPVWREWYPHRAMDKDLEDESFFMKHMVFSKPVTNLSEISCFHSALCEKLEELERQMPETKPHNPFTLSSRKPPPPLKRAEYRLRSTFQDVFIVLEKDWQQCGVILVWTSKEAAERHGCMLGDDVERYTGSLIAAGSTGLEARTHDVLDTDLLFSCSLSRAMQLVVLTDASRTVRHAKYESGNLIRQFGQGEDES